MALSTFANTSKSDFFKLYCSSPPLSVSCKPTAKPFSKKVKLLLKRVKDLNYIFDQSENSLSCDHFDIKDLKKVKIKTLDLSISYLNISSISSCIDNLKILLNLNTKFDITCISESTLPQKLPQATNIQLPGYNIAC